AGKSVRRRRRVLGVSVGVRSRITSIPITVCHRRLRGSLASLPPTGVHEIEAAIPNGLRGDVGVLAVRLACDVLCVFHGGPDEGDQGGGQNKNNRERVSLIVCLHVV